MLIGSGQTMVSILGPIPSAILTAMSGMAPRRVLHMHVEASRTPAPDPIAGPGLQSCARGPPDPPPPRPAWPDREKRTPPCARTKEDQGPLSGASLPACRPAGLPACRLMLTGVTGFAWQPRGNSHLVGGAPGQPGSFRCAGARPPDPMVSRSDGEPGPSPVIVFRDCVCANDRCTAQAHMGSQGASLRSLFFVSSMPSVAACARR